MPALSSVVGELYQLVDGTDPRRTTWSTLKSHSRDRAIQLAQHLKQLADQAGSRSARDRFLSASEQVLRFADALSTKEEAHAELKRHHSALARAYSQLTLALEPLTSERFPRVTPVNYTRNVFHVASGLTAAVMYHWFLDRTGAMLVMAVFAVTFTTLEILRRRSSDLNDKLMHAPFFRAIARPAEYERVNSSTFFAWGVLIAAAIASRPAVEAGCIVLAFGDPAASVLGKRFGRTKLLGNKSVVGTVAFITTGALAVLLFHLIGYPAEALSATLVFAFAAAIIGAAIELLSTRLDDNFTIPLGVALALTALFGG